MAVENKTTADVPGAAAAAPVAPPATPPAPPVPQATKGAPRAPPAPTQAPPPVVAPVQGDPEALANALEDLADAQAQVSDMDKWLADATVERTKRMQARDEAQTLVDKLQPIQTNGDAIRAYLDTQKAILTARGVQKQRVAAFEKENGFKLADLLPKRAPIDTAMARRNTRGMNRPGSGK